MNIRKLKVFYATATSLNMTKAAKDLYVSQPSISQSIQELESELDTILFDRIGKRLHLTVEGEVFLNYTRRILNLYEEAEESLKEIHKMEKGKIKIGASTTIGIYILPEIIKKFVEEHNQVEISLIVDNTANIENLILENKLDFAFVEGKIKSQEIKIEKVWEDELVFICSKNHKWSGRDYIERNELKEEKLIMREKGSGTREVAEAYLVDRNVDFNVFMKLGDTEAIKKSVEANLGIGCVSLKCIDDSLKVIRLRDEHILRDLNLIIHRDKFVNSNMKEFIKMTYK